MFKQIRYKKYVSTLIWLCFCSFSQAAPLWTFVYHRAISPSDFTNMDHKKMFAFAKQETRPFTQLIFAWNSVRPKSGNFSFYVQVRDKASKKWGTWHQMMDWGKKTQKSFMSKPDGMSTFHHVRLEMDPRKVADGFKIKIVAKEGADLKDLKAITITISNFNSFVPESGTNGRSLPSVYVPSVPTYSQFEVDHGDKHRMCSPTACAMLIDFIMQKKVKEPKKIAKKVFDEGLNAYGSWPFNTAYMYECCAERYWVFPTRLNSFIQLYNQLKRGLPVIVSVRGSLPNAPRAYTQGHLLVVVGYDARTNEVIVHDPAFPTNEQTEFRYPLGAFMEAWEKSHRLAYWLQPKRKPDAQ